MLKKLAANKRLYIALFFLAAIVGGSWYAASFRKNVKKEIASFDEDAWHEAVEESGIDIVDAEQVTEDTVGEQAFVEETVTEEPAVETVEETEVSAEDVTVVEVAVEDAVPFSMIKPCDGDILETCSLEELVYCAAMDDWRTHNGIDYTAAVGDSVYATADGVVAQTYEDELLGYTLVLNHQNDIVSVYGNLQAEDCQQVGAEVKKGDVLGKVGESGALEADMDSHLHFEVQCGGEYCDPVEYINAD